MEKKLSLEWGAGSISNWMKDLANLIKMKINELKELLLDFKSNVVFNQDLKNKNWFNIGGKCKVFFKAENLNDLIKFLKILKIKKKSQLLALVQIL